MAEQQEQLPLWPRPGLSSQHSDGGSQSSGSPVPRNPTSSSGLHWHQAYTQYRYLQAKHSYKNKQTKL